MDHISAAQILTGLKDATPVIEPALPQKKRGRPLTDAGRKKREEKARKALLTEIKKTAKSWTKKRRVARAELKAMTKELGSSSSC